MTSQPPTAPLASARLIVCERSGEWSSALRGELADAGVSLWECRLLAEAWSALAETPGAFAILEATRENLDDLLDRMTWLSRDFPDARAAVVADRALADIEWLTREAGAIHFVTSPRRLAPLVRIVVRHLATVPMPVQSLVERIWVSLPWPSHGM